MSQSGSRGREQAHQACGQKFRTLLSRAMSRSLPIVIFVGFLALYTITLAPDVLPADSGEFQRVAATAGIAHPPGYPLYTMLGWLFARLPLGLTPAWRVSFFSAVTSAATVVLLFSTARRLTGSVLGGIASALAFGSATTVWATATTASIRPLTALFAALCLYALAQHEAQREGSRGDYYVVLFFLALSLGLTHHPSLAFPGAVFTLYLLLRDPDLLRQPRRWVGPAIALLPGLLVLAYLPLRGAPQLATISGFLDHVLARGFRGDMFALSLLERVVLLPTLLRFQFNGVLVAGMAVGALIVLWQDGRLALLLIGSCLVHVGVTLTYDAPQTVEYAMPAYVPLVLLLAFPVGLLTDEMSWIKLLPSSWPGVVPAARIICRVAGAGLLVAALAGLAVHWPSYVQLSGSHDTRSYVETLLDEAPSDSVVLSNWHWFTPLRYVQEIEGMRPDVAVDYVAPGGEPLAETWVRAIREHVDDGPVVVVRFFEEEYRSLPYSFEPLGEAFLVCSEPREAVPSDLMALDAVIGERVELLGYRLVREEVCPGQPLILELAWSPHNTSSGEIGLFAQLIGPDGRLWSAAEDPRHPTGILSPGEIVVDRFVIYPQLHASPGEYTLVVGAYDSAGRLETEGGSDAVALRAVYLRPSTTRPVTQHPRAVRLTNGPTLIGVDYDLSVEGTVRTYLHWAGPGDPIQVRLLGDLEVPVGESRLSHLGRGEYATLAVDGPAVPSRLSVAGQRGERRWNPPFGGPVRLPAPGEQERYVPFGDVAALTGVTGPDGVLHPGTDVMLRLRLRAQRPLQRDYIVSTSLTGLNEEGTWAWRTSHDTVPGLGAFPTLKWIRGSTVVDPHLMEVPDGAPGVPAAASLLMYDHFTQRRLPHLDERLGAVVQLQSWQVHP